MSKEEKDKGTEITDVTVKATTSEPTNQTTRESSTRTVSSPYDVFIYSIGRAKNLIDIDIKPNGGRFQIPTKKLQDACRAAIVLSISALDAYIRVFVTRKTKQLLEKRELPKPLKEYIKRELFNKETFYNSALEPDFFNKLDEAFEKDFEKKSFQGRHSISHYMKLVGYDNIFRQISYKANKSADILEREIEKFTNRRHEIVHCGDLDLDQVDLDQTEPAENKIKKREVKLCIKLVELIAKHMHALIEEE